MTVKSIIIIFLNNITRYYYKKIYTYLINYMEFAFNRYRIKKLKFEIQ